MLCGTLHFAGALLPGLKSCKLGWLFFEQLQSGHSDPEKGLPDLGVTDLG